MASSETLQQEKLTWKETVHWMKNWDGSKLFYRAWRPPAPAQKALVLFHRGHEHSGRFRGVIEKLALRDFLVFAWDARGHGRSYGGQGHAENFMTFVKDADSFVRFISKQNGIPMENIVLMGHSVGSVIASAWVHDFAPPIRAMVLCTPAFRVRLYLPFAMPLLRLWQIIKPDALLKSYVKARMLTHDLRQAEEYENDSQISPNIPVHILTGLYDTSTRIVADAGAIRVPTLLLAAGTDWVVKLWPQRRFFSKLSSPRKKMEVLPNFYHGILHETRRHISIRIARNFILEAFENPSPGPSPWRAGEGDHNKEQHERLMRPLSTLSMRRWWYSCLKVMIKTIGRLSKGIQTGWRTGFDSGESLDYVYANKAQGNTALGKSLDRMYLNAIGWRGIRQRRDNLEKLLLATIQGLYSYQRPVRLVDIASGSGRYLLETLKKVPNMNLSALMRDRDPMGLEAGKRLACEMDISNVTFEQGDAFDFESLAAITPRPHIAIVSGLYELFSDNEMILRSLRGICEALEDPGYLIYTNQPWHPQVELIARTLSNREGSAWVMRCRAQDEMDALVRMAGFEKIQMEIGQYGIFTVSTAKRR